MIKQLQSDPKKIPQPSRDDMMRMLGESLQRLPCQLMKAMNFLIVTVTKSTYQ